MGVRVHRLLLSLGRAFVPALRAAPGWRTFTGIAGIRATRVLFLAAFRGNGPNGKCSHAYKRSRREEDTGFKM